MFGRSVVPVGLILESASVVESQRANGAVVRGVIAGALGGLAGTLAMNHAQRQWTLAVDGQPPASAAGKHDARDWQERSEGQNSNELAAQAVADATIERALTRREMSLAAPLVHFGFGALAGALYGAYAATHARPRSGLEFGMAVWLAADEIAMPLAGLSKATFKRPFEMHLQAFVAHLVYGAVTERVRRMVADAGTPGSSHSLSHHPATGS